MIHLFKILFFAIMFSLLIVCKVHAQQTPQALTPEGRIEGYHANYTLLDNTSAALYVIVKGLIDGFGYITESKETRDDLRGTCFYGEVDKPIFVACNNVTVNLLDENKKIIVSASTNENGDFRFFIPIGQQYYVQAVDSKGRSADLARKVGRGHFVRLLLKP